MALKTGDVALTFNRDLVDKSIRIAVSTMTKTPRNQVREAIVEKCTTVYVELRNHDSISKSELATKLTIPARTIERYFSLLRKAGLIAHIGPLKGGKWTFPK